MNMRIIEDISKFIFIEDLFEKSDVILVTDGSFPELPEKVDELWKNGYAKYIVLAGGV